ncbi:hypothetical protein AB0880_20970 [Micromonospora chersina]|uniref:hypothetical protein n=1 Tax=Micromonospora chersina TaxID=47854 RepID=UPI00345598E0
MLITLIVFIVAATATATLIMVIRRAIMRARQTRKAAMDLYVGMQDRATEDVCVGVYPLGTVGDRQPRRTIHGVGGGLAFDSSRNLYICDRLSRSISVYQSDSSGHVAPIRVIKGDRTGLTHVTAIALNGAGYLYALNTACPRGNVTVYEPRASGNTAPVAILHNLPPGNLHDIAIDSRDYLYIAADAPTSVTVYALGAVGQASPERRIAGPHTLLKAVSDLDFDSDDNLYVANSGHLAVFEAHVANGDVSPIRTFAGGGMIPLSLAVDPDGLTYVNELDEAQQSSRIAVFAPEASGNVSPIRVISGDYAPGDMAVNKPRTPRTQFAHWTSAIPNGDGADGTLHGEQVTLSGPMATAFYLNDDYYPDFNLPMFTPQLLSTGMVELCSGPGHSFTLNFGTPLQDPIFHLGSLASVLTFPPGTVVTRLCGDRDFAVTGNVVTGKIAPRVVIGDRLWPGDSNGSIRLTGVFDTITFTLVPNYAGGSTTEGVYFQVGGARPGSD